MADFSETTLGRRNKYRLTKQTLDAKRKLISKQVILMVGLIIDHSAFTQDLDVKDEDDMRLRKSEADNLKRLHQSLQVLVETEKFLVERQANDPNKVVKIHSDEDTKMFDNVNKKLKLAGLETINV